MEELARLHYLLAAQARPADYIEVDDIGWLGSLFPGIDEGSIATPVSLLGVPVYEVPALPAHTIRFIPPALRGTPVRLRIMGDEMFVIDETPPSGP